VNKIPIFNPNIFNENIFDVGIVVSVTVPTGVSVLLEEIEAVYRLPMKGRIRTYAKTFLLRGKVDLDSIFKQKIVVTGQFLQIKTCEIPMTGLLLQTFEKTEKMKGKIYGHRLVRAIEPSEEYTISKLMIGFVSSKLERQIKMSGCTSQDLEYKIYQKGGIKKK